MTATPRIQPVIMSGGAGTRLWPMSRAAAPKQFLPLLGEQTLFQETAARMRPDADESGPAYGDPLVICGVRHASLIVDQLADIGVSPAGVITEPAPRNTAAVAAVAALWSEAHAPDALVLLAAADHHIADPAGFRRAVAAGARAAARGAIATFGVRATEPHTGYGYIERAEAIAPDVFRVQAFHEKPPPETARAYLAKGGFYWNAGIFLFDPPTMLSEMEKNAAAILNAARAALDAASNADGVTALDADAFAACPSAPVDTEVMEKTDRAAVVAPVDVGWSDIGSWTALEPLPSDNIAVIDSDGAIIRTDGAFVGAVGAKDMIIVAAGDAVLVVHKSRAQDVKKIIDELKARGRTDLL